MQQERRRATRVAVQDHRVGLKVSSRVRVLDISSSGALLEGALLGEGVRGSLQIPLPSGPVAVDVEVRQQQTLVGDGGFESRSGVLFLNVSPASRRALEQLLSGARQ